MKKIFFIVGIFLYISLNCVGQSIDAELKALVDKINLEKRLNKMLSERKEILEKSIEAEIRIKKTLNARLVSYNDDTSQIRKDIDSLSLQIDSIKQTISFTFNKIRKLNATQMAQYKDINTEFPKAIKARDELNKSITVVNSEIDGINDSLEVLIKEIGKYNNIKIQYGQIVNEVSLLKSQLENKEKLNIIKKDSLNLITTIWNSAYKIKDDNKRNIAAIEQRLCNEINFIITKEDFFNPDYVSLITLSVDSINQLLQYKVQSNNLNQCKMSAEKYIAFALWAQNSMKAIQSDYDKINVFQLIIQGQQINNLNSLESQVKDKYMKLLLEYCDTYKRVLDDNKYLNSLSSADLIRKEIDYFISKDYVGYPYIISELKKKLSNPKYRCLFNQTTMQCD